MYNWREFFNPDLSNRREPAVFVDTINDFEDFVEDFSAMGVHYISKEKVESWVIDARDEFERTNKLFVTSSGVQKTENVSTNNYVVYHWRKHNKDWLHWNWKAFISNEYAVQCWTLAEALDFAEEYFTAAQALGLGIFSVRSLADFIERVQKVFFTGIVFDASNIMSQEKAEYMQYKIFQWGQVKHYPDEIYTSLRVEDIVPGSLVLRGNGIMYILIELSGTRMFVSKHGEVWMPDITILSNDEESVPVEDSILKVYDNDWSTAWSAELVNDGRGLLWKSK